MSSFVSASLGDVAAAAQQLTGIGSSITSANTVAAGSTTQVAVAAQDEVSAAIAAVFSTHGRAYQAVSAQVAQFHDQFAQRLSGAGGAYSLTEAANLSTLNGPNPAAGVPTDPGDIVLDETRYVFHDTEVVVKNITVATVVGIESAPEKVAEALNDLGGWITDLF
jgi:hypothetical protein